MPASNAEAHSSSVACVCLARAINAIIDGELDVARAYADKASAECIGFTYGYFERDMEYMVKYVRAKRVKNVVKPKTKGK